MSQVRLYLDEDAMRRSLVFALRSRNVDVLTAGEAGMIDHDDADHLALAASSGRVLYSFNVGDYCSLHQAWLSANRGHAGIVVAPQQRFTVGEELRRLMKLASRLTAEEMRNRIEFLTAWE